MMRWVFVALAALNVLFFGYSIFAVEFRGERMAAISADSVRETQFPLILGMWEQKSETIELRRSAPVVQAGCPAVGPLFDDEAAKNLLSEVQNAGFSGKLRSGVKTIEAVYLVYLPRLPSAADALRKARELHASGIDSYVISRGPDANALSVGLFSTRDAANGVVERLGAGGYLAELRATTKESVATWLVLDKPMTQDITEAIPVAYRGGLGMERLPCIGV